MPVTVDWRLKENLLKNLCPTGIQSHNSTYQMGKNMKNANTVVVIV